MFLKNKRKWTIYQYKTKDQRIKTKLSNNTEYLKTKKMQKVIQKGISALQSNIKWNNKLPTIFKQACRMTNRKFPQSRLEKLTIIQEWQTRIQQLKYKLKEIEKGILSKQNEQQAKPTQPASTNDNINTQIPTNNPLEIGNLIPSINPLENSFNLTMTNYTPNPLLNEHVKIVNLPKPQQHFTFEKALTWNPFQKDIESPNLFNQSCQGNHKRISSQYHRI